jgi:hypothetical protein
MPLTRPRKIKTQLRTITDSVAQKEEEPDQILIYIGILTHIRCPRLFASQPLMEEKPKSRPSITMVVGSLVDRLL